MLQRKLLVTLGSLIAILVVAAVSAIALLHVVLEDLIETSAATADATVRTHDVEAAASAVETELRLLRHRLDSPAAAAETLDGLEARVAALGDLRMPPAVRARVDRLEALLPVLGEGIDTLGTPPDDASVDAALATATLVREEVAAISTVLMDLGRRDLERVVVKFRGAGIVAGLVWLVLLNASIAVVLRAAVMVLKPVNQLVDASRRLGREEFDHRVHVTQRDEFGELATAYNALAEQLQANEQRKLETLQQVSRTLAHELNNAISTIELQLTLMDRRVAGDAALAGPLREAHQSLARMSRTIDALKRVRKIVLTDYLSGVKMLDLERSVQDEPPSETPAEVAELKPR